MKKIFTAALLGLLLSAQAEAQSFGLGVKGGLNVSRFGGEDGKNTDFRPGVHAGIMMDLGVANSISLQPEVLYSTKGYRQKIVHNVNHSSTYRARIDYLDIPLLLKLKASNLFVEIGPQLSFLLSAKEEEEVELKAGTATSVTKNETTTTDDFNTTDFAMTFGIGYRAGNGVGLGLRYCAGLKDIGDEGRWADRKVRNNTFQLSLSYLLNHR